MRKEIAEFVVNGIHREVLLPVHMTLIELLRDELQHTGTKESCGSGDCGCCTVLIDGKPALACLTLAVSVRGKHIETIEGLAKNGELNPLQQAFVENGAVQCGYCTPGMIMSSKHLLDENPDPTEDDIKKALGGNLCRCTGYKKITGAVQLAAKRR